MEAADAVLKRILRDIGPCLVAFSGGVDSTLLLRIAHDTLGDGATAVTAVSPSLPASEKDETQSLARLIGARHVFIETHELDDERYTRNDGARCYYCKTELFRVLKVLAAEAGGRALVYGAIADDRKEDRPGMRAAEEAGVRAPLAEAGLDKESVRELSRRLGLPTWDKPAMACLASRVPTDTRVTRQDLLRVERAEAALKLLGYRQVRVRLQGQGARVELDRDGLTRAARPVEGEKLIRAVVLAGFESAVIDPLGYRTGRPAPPRTTIDL
jgi:pyridinium-3,5-biscarboxylic acid mononucleotide sulfurtransferase